MCFDVLGTYAVPCESDSKPDTTKCIGCVGDTFMPMTTTSSDGYYECEPRQHCGEGIYAFNITILSSSVASMFPGFHLPEHLP